MQQVNAGAAHLHFARNIFPALHAQITQFQQQAAIRVRDQRDGLANLLLDVEEGVDLAVERALRFDQAHDRVLHAVDVPAVGHALAAKQKNGKDLLAMEVYEETWKWLAERNCAQLIPAQILEQYAMAISRWIQCEECITEYGFLAKHPTTGNAIPSPYVAMSQSFSKQANNLWYQIYQVVRENCAVEYRGATPHDDMMERLLTARRGG